MRVAIVVMTLCVCFSISVWADDHGDSPLAATPIEIGGDLLSACLEVGGDMDYFFFSATAGRTYQLLTSHLDTGADTDIASGLSMEARCVALCFATEDRREGMAAFLEKREAAFKNK